MADMPKSVRVGYATYKIEQWPTELASAVNRYGECDTMNNVIRIRPDLSPQEASNTLLHEILHGVWTVGACGDGDEEKCVTIVANQLTQVIQDNPKVWDWITKNARAT